MRTYFIEGLEPIEVPDRPTPIHALKRFRYATASTQAGAIREFKKVLKKTDQIRIIDDEGSVYDVKGRKLVFSYVSWGVKGETTESRILGRKPVTSRKQKEKDAGTIPQQDAETIPLQNEDATREDATTRQRVGYVRVSTFDQNPDRQLEDQPVHRLFTEHASGKDTKRPELDRLLSFVREGDTVVVHSMDRLARNLDDLRSIVRGLTDRGVRVEFVKEKLTFTGEDSPISNLLLSVMGAFAEFERALLRERQLEGIALAKKRGAYKGRKKALSPEQAADLRKRAAAGEQKAALARDFGISRDTLYRYLKAGT